MNNTIKMEYDTPKTTIIILSENSVICTSVESFTEDSELVW